MAFIAGAASGACAAHAFITHRAGVLQPCIVALASSAFMLGLAAAHVLRHVVTFLVIVTLIAIVAFLPFVAFMAFMVLMASVASVAFIAFIN